jgi:hypothetical protein
MDRDLDLIETRSEWSSLKIRLVSGNPRKLPVSPSWDPVTNKGRAGLSTGGRTGQSVFSHSFECSRRYNRSGVLKRALILLALVFAACLVGCGEALRTAHHDAILRDGPLYDGSGGNATHRSQRRAAKARPTGADADQGGRLQSRDGSSKDPLPADLFGSGEQLLQRAHPQGSSQVSAGLDRRGPSRQRSVGYRVPSSAFRRVLGSHLRSALSPRVRPVPGAAAVRARFGRRRWRRAPARRGDKEFKRGFRQAR